MPGSALPTGGGLSLTGKGMHSGGSARFCCVWQDHGQCGHHTGC
jgi:hypothetical protein